MSKVDKKKKKLVERIQTMETELTMALTKKTSDVKEINIASHQSKILALKKELASL